MKEPWDWVESDINELIANQVQESLLLDYKSRDALRRAEDRKRVDLCKDVSAFANSAGGILVYGVEEDKHFPTQIDDGYDPNDITKEWIEQVINSGIQRRVGGIIINQIHLSGLKAGRVMYVVIIPQSPDAPHMASDNRYYKRFNFESVPMEEYEVRDVARRVETPELYVSVHASKLVEKHHWFRPPSLLFHLEFAVGNKNSLPVEDCFLNYYWDRRLFLGGGNSVKTSTKFRLWTRQSFLTSEIHFDGAVVPVFYDSFLWKASERNPIFDSVINVFASLNVLLRERAGPYYLCWEARAPYMTVRRGAFQLQLGSDEVHLAELPDGFRLKNRRG
jgi:hypothetical protein